MAVITEGMKRAAREFQSEAIDAGFDMAKNVYESPEWTESVGTLRIFGVDVDNHTHTWEEGD